MLVHPGSRDTIGCKQKRIYDQKSKNILYQGIDVQVNTHNNYKWIISACSSMNSTLYYQTRTQAYIIDTNKMNNFEDID